MPVRCSYGQLDRICAGPDGCPHCRRYDGHDDPRRRGRLGCRRSDAALANGGTNGTTEIVPVPRRRQNSACQTGEVLQHLWRRVCQRPWDRHLHQARRLRALRRCRQTLILSLALWVRAAIRRSVPPSPRYRPGTNTAEGGRPKSAVGVRRDKAALSSGCESHPASALVI
jgi:hypothetical protein